MTRVTIPALHDRKRRGEKIFGVVAWDTHMAAIADRVGVDIVSVGDTVGKNLWGRDSIHDISMDEMVIVTRAARRGVKNALLSADLPYGPLQEGVAAAVRAGIRLVKEAGIDLLKLDGAADYLEAVTALTRAGIPVWAQFGLTPQTALASGIAYENQAGATEAAPGMAERLVAQARELEAAGAVLLDFTNSGPVIGPQVVAAVRIPVIGGFGGGPWLDGRVRLAQAAVGYDAAFLDREPKGYANVARVIHDALAECAGDVRAGRQIKGQPGGSAMPMAEIDGIETYYQTVGDGPPLLMFAPGGFDARIGKWSDLGVYQRIRLLDHLPRHFTCILFDRRENGRSGGRVERIGWGDFVAQGAGLLDHLGIARAHLLGGCMGCAPVAAFAVRHPARVASMVLYWPVGGAHYRLNAQQRFARHLAFAEENGLGAVVDLVRSHDRNFSADPRGGPWGQPIRNSDAFARAYAALDLPRYLLTVRGTVEALFDRDTAPGAPPEELMRCDVPALIVPGADKAHATSAARYLQECLPRADYWDAPPEAQTEDTAPARVLEFLARHASPDGTAASPAGA